jgi:GNAT superfamily N-acetyltransferase
MAAPPQIRPFARTDHDDVLELAPRLTVGVAAWRDPDAVAFVCVTGGRIAGFASVSTTVHFSGERDAYIGELVVADDLEDRGIGRQLVAAAEQWAAESMGGVVRSR